MSTRPEDTNPRRAPQTVGKEYEGRREYCSSTARTTSGWTSRTGAWPRVIAVQASILDAEEEVEEEEVEEERLLVLCVVIVENERGIYVQMGGTRVGEFRNQTLVRIIARK
jgi:hypothetical protein